MTENAEYKILVIDQDTEESELMVEAALQAYGYGVQSTDSGDQGLRLLAENQPDLMILDLHLEGLSGRDVLAALSAQSVDIPVILLANEGSEREALQAFRLGAKDYVVRPFREAELVQVVERALKEVRLQRQSVALQGELQHAAEATQVHLQGLQTLMGIGKSITMLRSLNEVFPQVIKAAFELTRADVAGFYFIEEQTGRLILRAGQNLSGELSQNMGRPIKDDLASLVTKSLETYQADSDGLGRFNLAESGAVSVIYAPLAVHGSAMGVLWVLNKSTSFEPYMKDLMTALADYAAIAVVNTRLFASVQDRSRQQGEVAKASEEKPAAEVASPPDNLGAAARQALLEMREPLDVLLRNMNMFRTGEMGPIRSSHQAAVDVMHRQIAELSEKVAALTGSDPDDGVPG